MALVGMGGSASSYPEALLRAACWRWAAYAREPLGNPRRGSPPTVHPGARRPRASPLTANLPRPARWLGRRGPGTTCWPSAAALAASASGNRPEDWRGARNPASSCGGFGPGLAPRTGRDGPGHDRPDGQRPGSTVRPGPEGWQLVTADADARIRQASVDRHADQPR